MAQVLLINPSAGKGGGWEGLVGLPIGLAYIGSVLIEQGYTVAALDLGGEERDPLRRVEESLRREAPSIVGISCRTPEYPAALAIARLAKEAGDVKVIAGGPHVTFLPRESLAGGEIDVVVRGEGEESIVELARCFLDGKGELGSIKGIAYREDGEACVTPVRSPERDLDSLPFPARSLFAPLTAYRFPGGLSSSRGCPAGCIFCSVRSLCGRQIRLRKAERVFEESRLLLEKHGVWYVNYLDDIFTLHRPRTLALCRMLRSLGVAWSCATRVNSVDGELLREMKAAGCRDINYGVESGSQRILDSIGKEITKEQVRKAVRFTADAGIIPLCSFMIPHPMDDRDSVRETMDFMDELNRMNADISINFTVPFPGTELYLNRKRYGIRMETADWELFDGKHSIISTRNLSAEEVQDLVDAWMAEQAGRAR